MSIVYLNIRGGLGNQLFQILSCYLYCEKHNKKLQISQSICTFGEFTRNKVYWENLLDSFKNNLCDNFPDKNTMQCVDDNELYKTEFENDIIVVGYFQKYTYFHEYNDNIYRYLDLETKKNKLKEILNINFENTISIHFRLGDYKIHQDCHPILPLHYYERSLDFIFKTHNKTVWNILYTCEDEDVNEVNIKILHLKEKYSNATFLRLGEKLDDWEQMLAMSLCDHNIMANSTFSWFSAYFNKNKNKCVCYPSLWYCGKMPFVNFNELFLPEWNKIEVCK